MVTLRAVLLIRVRPGFDRFVLDRLYGIPEVESAYLILGDYDVCAIVVVREELVSTGINRLYSIIRDRVKCIDGIIDVNVLLSLGYRIKKHGFTPRELAIPTTPL